MTERLQKFFDFVKEKHGNQERKYTGEPYWVHLKNVYDIVETVTDDELLLCVALGHDLLEDVYGIENKWALIVDVQSVGFDGVEAYTISHGIYNLSDKFTKELYPNLNRKKRKELEIRELSLLDSDLHTVKCADLIDNTSSIVEFDRKFAKVYLEEKMMILDSCRKGDLGLLVRAYLTCVEAKRKLAQ